VLRLIGHLIRAGARRLQAHLRVILRPRLHNRISQFGGEKY
jgi:hypothetical protein